MSLPECWYNLLRCLKAKMIIYYCQPDKWVVAIFDHINAIACKARGKGTPTLWTFLHFYTHWPNLFHCCSMHSQASPQHNAATTMFYSDKSEFRLILYKSFDLKTKRCCSQLLREPTSTCLLCLLCDLWITWNGISYGCFIAALT